MSRLAHLRDALTYGLARPCTSCRAAEAIEGDALCADCHAESCAAPPALVPSDVARWADAPTVALLRRAAVHHRDGLCAAAASLALALVLAVDPGYLAHCDAERDAAWELMDAANDRAERAGAWQVAL